MPTDEDLELIINGTIRHLSGAGDEDDEDLYFEMMHVDAAVEWHVLDEVATRSAGVIDAMSLGIGPLMSFVIAYGSIYPELIVEGIQRNARLRDAFRHVRGVGQHPALVEMLPNDCTYES